MLDWKKLLKKIPSKVQITKTHFYEVVWVDSFSSQNVMGETRFDKRQIAIKKQMSPKLTVITYLHEVLHAISGEHDAELTEKQVLALEKSFYYFLKTNNIFKETE